MDNKKKYLIAAIVEVALILIFGLYLNITRKYGDFLRLACDATFTASILYIAIGAIGYVAKKGGFDGMRFLSYKTRKMVSKDKKDETTEQGDKPEIKTYSEFVKEHESKTPSAYALLKVGGIMLVISIVLTVIYEWA